jgi:hypothetical protein
MGDAVTASESEDKPNGLLTVCLVLVLVEVQMPSQYQYRIELKGTVQQGIVQSGPARYRRKYRRE